MSAYDLNDTVAIVTGGAKGMGEAHCRLMVERGATVFVADLDPVGETLAAEIGATFVSLDVTQEDQWEALCADVVAQHGRIDVLVNNAGVASVKPVNEATVEDFDFVFNANMKGVFLGCKHVLPGMQAAGKGSIVNISSSGGIKAVMPNLSLYIASKGAVRLFTKAVAVDYAQYRIRANSIHPGLILTALNKEYLEDPKMLPVMMGSTLFDRPGETREVAEAVAFLASDASSYMTGAELAVDGGWTCN